MAPRRLVAPALEEQRPELLDLGLEPRARARLRGDSGRGRFKAAHEQPFAEVAGITLGEDRARKPKPVGMLGKCQPACHRRAGKGPSGRLLPRTAIELDEPPPQPSCAAPTNATSTVGEVNVAQDVARAGERRDSNAPRVQTQAQPLVQERLDLLEPRTSLLTPIEKQNESSM